MTSPEEAVAKPARFKFFNRHWTWWMTVLTLAIVFAARLRLLNYPLERDEGEYAYAGQLMLQGIPPYELAYNMKFPGTYAAYALIMALFGQTTAGIHFGLACMTTLTAIMLYWLGKQMLDSVAGMAAATSYAVLAANPTMLALSGHATHFVVFFAMGGLCLMWQAWRLAADWWLAAASGFMFGMAVLMKQQAILIGGWAAMFLAWTCLRPSSFPLGERLRRLAAFCLGTALPFGLCCLILWRAGVFEKFWFWTIAYARQYATLVPLSEAPKHFFYIFPWIISRDLSLWLLAAVGVVLIWFDDRLQGMRPWLVGFSLISALTVVPGFYFREHYFIVLLPALALLGACAVSGACHLWRQRIGKGKFSLWPAGIFVLMLIALIYRNYFVWFKIDPAKLSRILYGPSAFAEAEVMAKFVRANTAPNDRIAVMGSEPEIYFLSHRHSVTGYIYTYALMEPQPFARQMQNEMISQVETSAPQFIVFANLFSTWNRVTNSDLTILHWWDSYKTNYTLVGVADVISPSETHYLWGDDALHYGGLKKTGLEVYHRNQPVTPAAEIQAADRTGEKSPH